MTAGNEAPFPLSTRSVQHSTVWNGTHWCGLNSGNNSLWTAVFSSTHTVNAVSLDSPRDVCQKWNFWTASQSLKKCKADIWITQRTKLYHSP